MALKEVGRRWEVETRGTYRRWSRWINSWASVRLSAVACDVYLGWRQGLGKVLLAAARDWIAPGGVSSGSVEGAAGGEVVDDGALVVGDDLRGPDGEARGNGQR